MKFAPLPPKFYQIDALYLPGFTPVPSILFPKIHAVSQRITPR